MKKIIIIVLILIAGGAVTAWYLYNKPVADMNDLKADYSLTAVELFNAFNEDENAANNKFLGKIVEVSGTVREVKADAAGQSVILETDDMIFGINCGLSQDQQSNFDKVKAGNKVTIKGECTGISMDVVLVRCIIVNAENK